MGEWKTYRLGEIATFKYGKLPPKNSNIGQYPIWSGYRYVGYTNTFNCPKNSIIVIARGVGGTGDVKIAKEDCFLTNLSIIVNIDTSICNPYYFYYQYLLSNLKYLDSGSAQSQITIEDLKRLNIKLPSPILQNRTVEILKSLDDKIELNRRINANLEAQAQALFRSWFVDFEPFRDGPFVDSQLGKIPQGWKVVELGDVTKQQTEKVGPQKTVKVLSPITTGELVLSQEYFTKQLFSESIAKYIIVKPNQFAYNPARINIGSIGRNTFEFDGCVSPVYVVFECEKGYHYFFDFFRKTDALRQEVISRAIGGVRQTLGYKDFALIKVIYPPQNVIQEFNALYINLLNLQNHTKREITTLSALRDTLLPKLMAGEINVE